MRGRIARMHCLYKLGVSGVTTLCKVQLEVAAVYSMLLTLGCPGLWREWTGGQTRRILCMLLHAWHDSG